MKRIESLLARILLILVSLVLCFAALELGARFYMWHVATEDEFKQFASINQIKDRFGADFFISSQSSHKSERLLSPHHFLGYYPTPNLDTGENKHNALGFRGDDVLAAKDEETYRIVAVGGSTTYSTGVDSYRQSYPYHLAEYLSAQQSRHVEVINAGAVGYFSYHNLINIQFRIIELVPDLIVIYQGINDVDTRFVFPSSRYLGDNSGHIAPYVSDTVMPAIWEYSTVMRLLGIRTGITSAHAALDWHYRVPATSSFRAEFIGQWYAKSYPSGIFADVSAMQMLESNPPVHFERNLRNMLAVAQGHNVDVLLVTFVTASTFDRVRVASEEYIFGISQHNEVTRRIAETNGTALLDLARAFPDDRTLFVDGMHMTARGNQIRAKLIGDFVVSEFLT